MTRQTDSDGTGAAQTPLSKGSSEDRITDAIKQAYDDVANEPLPDKLNDLLDQLRNGGKE